MESSGTDTLIFFVNGEKIIEKNPDPTCTLLYYLRTTHIKGCKQVCGEGGCGACTVMISRYDPNNKKIVHYSVNACITPVCSVHGLAVTTTEGIGSLRTRLHPVQEQIAKSHGSQCGFCTPGMVMSMYALLRNNPQPSIEDIENYVAGNLCRCTGYRPILDGYRAFSKETCSLGEKCCKSQDNKKAEDLTEQLYLVKYDPTQEPIFPPELKLYHEHNENQFLMFDNKGVKWYRPVLLSQLLDLKDKYPDSKIIVGNTEVGIETRLLNQKYDVLIDGSRIPELNSITENGDGITLGASVTLTKIENFLKKTIDKEPEEKTRILKAVVESLKWFASKQIKNVASIGGNIITASTLSDINPILQAVNAKLSVISKGKQPRYITVDEKFFIRRHQTVVKNNEILLSVTLPYSSKNEYIMSYKQATRKDDDTAIVNAGMKVSFQEGTNIIKALYLSYGGMAATTVMATGTMKKLIGRKWEDDLIISACEYLAEDLPLVADSPGGTIEYRRTLTTSFFFKFYLTVAQQLSVRGILQQNYIPESVLSVLDSADLGPSRSSQFYEKVNAAQKVDNPIGRPIVHESAYQQATGEAVYVDDMISLKGELHIAPVYSSRAHAKLLSVDVSAAVQVAGVIGYVDHTDVPGSNYIDMAQAEFLAIDEVTREGCFIGGIIATTSEIAREAVKLVQIEYQDLPTILTIKEAIANKSYLTEQVTACGDVDAGWSYCEEIIEEEVYMGCQEHFYFETQSARAEPKERDEIDIYVSSQLTSSVQGSVAAALGIESNKVKCIIKRTGGGFGGKMTHALPTALLASIAAKKFNKPVRCVLERQDDIVTTGGRHPVYVKYKVGFSTEGRISTIDLHLYANAGNTFDISMAVFSNIISRLDMSYKIPNFRINAYLCKTNTRSNTPMRAAGTVQSMFIMENIVQHVIDHLKAEPTKIRALNFYKEGERTHVNQIVKNCNIQAVWEECLVKSDYYNRKRLVDQFNRENRWKKRGIVIVPMKYGNSFELKMLNQAGALVNVNTDGSVLVAHGGIEIGQGLNTKMLQIASATLGVPIDRIHINEAGSNTVPNTVPTAASTGSDLIGNAVKLACEKLVKRLEPYTNEKGTSWNDWVKKAFEDRVGLSATGFYKSENLGYDPETDSFNKYYYYSFGAGCSEIEIDCLTGDHKVLRTDIVMDVGTSLNPAVDIGQIEGAFIQGYGLFMLEKFKISPKGNVITRNTSNYKIPSMTNIPHEFNVSLLKGHPNAAPGNIFSSKAVGEPPLVLAMSVFLAAKSAIMAARQESGIEGYFHFESPATPDNIRMSCIDQFTRQFPAAEEGTFTPWFVKL